MRGRKLPESLWFPTLMAAVLCLGSGCVLGFKPVPGMFGGESFTCGSAFIYDNSGGYRGSDGFATCNEERKSRLAPASCLILCGFLLGGLVVRAAQKQDA